MRVLVTGAAGLIGRVSMRLLEQSGHEVLGTDLHPCPAGLADLSWRRLDIRRGEQVRETLAASRPEAVVHLAARHFIPWCERFPAATLHTNVVGSQNVIEGVLEAGARKLVFASSAAVYGSSPRALNETSPLGPDDVYGTSKVMGEQLVKLARGRGAGFDAVLLRLFNTIGPGDGNPHLLPRLLAELRGGGEQVRLGNLDSVRDYVFVEDVARAIVAAVERDLPGLNAVNVGSGQGRSVQEVVRALAEQVGRELRIVSVSTRRRAVDRPFLVADTSRAGALLGWEPLVSFEQGLARTLHAELVAA
ncbi:MAG TPA: NAD(P)-dependent oxidoreductase [Solirubrobacteraceae bacterium]|jgi:UDP-glucose 4-epimerase